MVVVVVGAPVVEVGPPVVVVVLVGPLGMAQFVASISAWVACPTTPTIEGARRKRRLWRGC